MIVKKGANQKLGHVCGLTRQELRSQERQKLNFFTFSYETSK